MPAYATPARAPIDEATPATGVPAAAVPPAPRFDPPPIVEAPLDTGSRLPRLNSMPPPPPPPEPVRPAVDEVRAAQERVLQKAAELERMVRSGTPDEGTPSPMPAPAPEGPTLVLYAEGREVDRVSGNRFLIGRGKHCDLIINSGKVSREHAAITREGDGGFYIEDLGSSNGTWFDKKRITRRRIEDGDDYFVCSEKLTCRLQ